MIRVIREPSAAGATLGALYVAGVWQCWTLEDEIREHAGTPVEQWKVAGQTAIPAGEYKIVLSRSVRFSLKASQKSGVPVDVVTPEILAVPGFTGIRIHPGNAAADTEGCILVGKMRMSNTVLQSQDAFDALMARLRRAPDISTIRLENPE
jgi:hypothetical protein